MPRPRPFDSGNLQPLDSKLEDRTVAILESDVLKQIVDNSVAGVTYICKAQTGSKEESPVWQIQRITETNNIQTIEWADGDGLFDNKASDRLTITYR